MKYTHNLILWWFLSLSFLPIFFKNISAGDVAKLGAVALDLCFPELYISTDVHKCPPSSPPMPAN